MMPNKPQSHRPNKLPRRDERPNAAARGYDRRWRNLRMAFLRENPCCVLCRSEGIHTSADVVDHKIPHKGDPALLFDWNNLRPLCKRHHDKVTAEYDGAFGRDTKPKPEDE